MAFARPVLPLFRPIAGARPAAITQIHRFSQCSRFRKEAEVTTASTTAPVDANAPAVEQVQSALLPYFVLRTSSNNLPVYVEKKSGGNRIQTKVRKVSGDVIALRKALQKYLSLPEDDISVNNERGYVIAKGNHHSKIVEFLESKKL
ncbi:54S ribosomal protein img2 [Lasiodiplodia hormozganensis]|uniref:Large ribosomal subunit protein mL49 n=1 Tax=Lasiodiplodia hormozganensis TaxID=869390 RepID=A0AA39YD19_9PEZI|nr:54S ribosomal protein img2 [Lasiodiplodia hormozganensis]